MEDKKPEENKMEIEISKYKNLVDALGDPVRVARMVLLIAAVAAILAAGIVAVVYGIKRFYPYKSINSNPYGATIIQDEDNEIIYWLFNTADLWANSGIEVKEGDIVSVRTSGAFHTAIHHLVQDADSNTKLRNPWSISKGKGPLPESPLYDRNNERNKYRIAPNLPQNTILMQVVPDIEVNNDTMDWRAYTEYACYVDGQPDTVNSLKPDIYEIGQGKENIRIRTNGILHFTVNDIALTKRVIKRMKDSYNYEELLEIKEVKGVWFAKTTDMFNSLFSDKGKNLLKLTYEQKKKQNNIKPIKIDSISSEELSLQHFKNRGLLNKQGETNINYWNNDDNLKNCIIESIRQHIINDTTYLKGFKKTELIELLESLCLIDEQPQKTIDSLNDKEMHTDSIIKNIHKRISDTSYKKNLFENIHKYLDDSSFLIITGLGKNVWVPNELEYYQYTNFVDAWFVDNIGSFLIVIERKRVK